MTALKNGDISKILLKIDAKYNGSLINQVAEQEKVVPLVFL
jgi:hypothetical protein